VVNGQADVQALRALYEAFNRRDIEGLMDCFDPAIVIAETTDLEYAARLLRVLGPRFVILSGGYHGREEVRRLFESVWEIAETFTVEPLDFIAAADRIVVPLELRAKARDTGAEGRAGTAHLWEMAGGRATRLQVFADQQGAVAAASTTQART
jgi:ketosteroid isomerase-like protein